MNYNILTFVTFSIFSDYFSFSLFVNLIKQFPVMHLTLFRACKQVLSSWADVEGGDGSEGRAFLRAEQQVAGCDGG